jgi:hypothetical protein
MRVTRIVKQQVNMVRNWLTGGRARMGATDLLEIQHREVDLLFGRIERADSGREKRSLVEELADKLAAHMAIEQEIFYPACLRETTRVARIRESYEEHAVARFELERLVATGAADPAFDARVTVLKETIRDHVREEERSLFPAAERRLGRERLVALGVEMRARFEELVQRGHAAVLASASARPEMPATRKSTRRIAAKRARGAGAATTGREHGTAGRKHRRAH